jgi:hypothetical protein
VLAGQSHCLDYFFDALRNHNADRHLPVIRTIDGVKSAGAIIKADFTRDGGAQLSGERIGVGTGFRSVPVLDLWRHA